MSDNEENFLHVYLVRSIADDHSQEFSSIFVETDRESGAGRTHRLSPDGIGIYECKFESDPLGRSQFVSKKHIGYTPISSHPTQWSSVLEEALKDKGYRYHATSDGSCSGSGPDVGTGTEIEAKPEVGMGWRRVRAHIHRIPTLRREDAVIGKMPVSRSATWVTDCAIPVLKSSGLLHDSSWTF